MHPLQRSMREMRIGRCRIAAGARLQVGSDGALLGCDGRRRFRPAQATLEQHGDKRPIGGAPVCPSSALCLHPVSRQS